MYDRDYLAEREEDHGGAPCMCALCDCTEPVDGDAAICDDCRAGEHER